MQHEYTAHQLDYAMWASHDITGDDNILEVSSEGIRAFLNSLPDQPGDDALREQAGLYKELIDHPFFKDWSISGTSVRSFMMSKLDSAMTPQDDWQECGFNDFRPTDKRVKAAFIGGSIIEGTPDRRNSEHVFLVDGPVISSHDDATFYRIPAPVVHPDPTECPVIYAKDSDIVNFVPKIMVWYRDSYVAGWQGLSPEQITDWQQIDPAKVVADND